MDRKLGRQANSSYVKGNISKIRLRISHGLGNTVPFTSDNDLHVAVISPLMSEWKFYEKVSVRTRTG